MCPHTTPYYYIRVLIPLHTTINVSSNHYILLYTCPHTTIYQVHSPKLQNAAPEGGSAVFHVDFFGANASLAQSPQIYKQMAGV
jgi:hypothetical protein